MHKIDTLRKKKGLTIEQLAESMVTTRVQIGRLKKNNDLLSGKWIKKLSKALGCHAWEITPEEWCPPPTNRLDVPLLSSMIERVMREMDKIGLEMEPHVVAGIAASFYAEILERKEEITEKDINRVIRISSQN